MLFYGPAGTGKTTTAICIARENLTPNEWRNYFIELNASDERGIDVVRKQDKASSIHNNTRLSIQDHIPRRMRLTNT